MLSEIGLNSIKRCHPDARFQKWSKYALKAEGQTTRVQGTICVLTVIIPNFHATEFRTLISKLQFYPEKRTIKKNMITGNPLTETIWKEQQQTKATFFQQSNIDPQEQQTKTWIVSCLCSKSQMDYSIPTTLIKIKSNPED